MNRADRWLHGELRMIREWDLDGADEPTAKALAGVDALEAAGAIGAEAAEGWRARFRDPAPDPALAAPEQREAGERLLQRLLREVPRGAGGVEPSIERFNAAVHLLATLGAADPRAWDDRLRERAGWPSEEEEMAIERELNAGGTETELLEVIAGPPDERAGFRLLLVLRFADGVSVLVERPARAPSDFGPPEWRLEDDLGTRYPLGGAAGGGTEEHLRFRGAVPPQARRLRLSRPEAAFEVPLA